MGIELPSVKVAVVICMRIVLYCLCAYKRVRQGGALMVRRICPICDRVMKMPHYCTTCKSWVRHPYVRDVTYYLNERHPNVETECEYHDGGQQKRPTPVRQTGQMQRTVDAGRDTRNEQGANGNSGWVRNDRGRAASESSKSRRRTGQETGSPAAMPTMQRPRAAMPDEDCPDTMRQNVERSRQERERNRNKQGTGLMIFFVLMLLIIGLNIVRVIVSVGWDLLQDLGVQVGSGIVAEPDTEWFPMEGEDEWSPKPDADSEWSDTYTEFEDWEVREDGVACTMDGHFAISGENVADWMRELLGAYGLVIADESDYSYNVRYQDDDTWFATWRAYDLETEDEDRYPYVEINWDTATGELHSVEMMLETTGQYLSMTGDVLAYLKEEGAISAEEQELFDAAEWAEVVDDRSEYEAVEGSFSIWGTAYGEDYSVMISRIAE